VGDALGAGSLQGENLKLVHRNALRLLRLVNSLLDFSRIEAGALTSSFEPTDLPALTAALAGSFHSLIAPTGIRFTVNCPPMTDAVNVDHSHWEKIVLNLVSNAFKFTFAGEIAVHLRTVGDHVELSVRDTGTGIPVDALPKIFDRFYRVAGAHGRSFEGTGIGLALVSELARAHGGTVRAESVVGRGSLFVVAIPRRRNHLLDEQAVSRRAKAAKPSIVHPVVEEASGWMPRATTAASEVVGTPDGHRILVADDSADMRMYLRTLLSPHWTVEVVEDGRAALESALANPPDLLVSDVMMPRMDGVAVLRAMRDDPRTAGVPVVLLSARTGEEAVLEGLETLADDYLVKPFSARELLTRIRTHLRMATIRQRLQSHLLVADRMSAVGTLAAGVAHEINNPLSYVTSNLDLVAEEIRTLSGGSPSSLLKNLSEMIEDARVGAERVRKIVRGMKTFSRVDEERRQPLDVHAVLDLSINMTFNEIRHRARIVKDFGAIPFVEADEGQLGQVFVNLLVNAAHAIPEGLADANEIRIVTKTDASGGGVIEIRDTGHGIQPAVLKRIFDPFFTTKPVGSGTGLGLSICHGIVKGLGGQIVAESVPGHGSTFRITLPAARLATSVPVVEAAAVSARSIGRVGRVLVVDDDVMVGRILRRILGDEHDLTLLTSGQQAIDLILGGARFDVMFCDLMMPQVTGMTLHAVLKNALPEVINHIVFLTGGAFTPTAQAFLDSVPNQRIEKPFCPQNLRAVVRSFLGEPPPLSLELGA
jgi:signal transduction histidine kinase